MSYRATCQITYRRATLFSWQVWLDLVALLQMQFSSKLLKLPLFMVVDISMSVQQQSSPTIDVKFNQKLKLSRIFEKKIN